ncbi:hypothetical protein GCM10011594_32400 [Nakamurella endophytica]|uniref:Uncharacterized protein n=1 Tax=Nakamurella endophytica TaxID=1748367 RepID=A0A917T4K4_9ACTN|nr:hypothetical protein GCM10011594_32400 [Nakamurella endophytica]
MFQDCSPVGDWSVLLERLDRAGAFGRWRTWAPELATVPSPAGLPSCTAVHSDRGESDRVLGALIRVAAVDGMADPDAALVLLHLLSDGIYSLASRLPHPWAEAVALVAGELTCQIRSFPWRRRTRAYAANLLLDTKHALLKELPALGPDGTRRDVSLDPLDSLWRSLPAPAEAPAAQEVMLTDLMRWAERNSIADPDDLRMLVALQERAGYGSRSRHRIAAELGINERTLRRRRDRTLAALRAAGPRFLLERAA